jgi:hypothetical protein
VFSEQKNNDGATDTLGSGNDEYDLLAADAGLRPPT